MNNKVEKLLPWMAGLAIALTGALIAEDIAEARTLGVHAGERAISRYEHAYWKGYPVHLRVHDCQRHRRNVLCRVSATGVWAEIVDGSGNVIGRVAPSTITYLDEINRRGRIAVIGVVAGHTGKQR